jgi:YHS domain-containing protein
MQRISGSLDEGRITFGEHKAEPDEVVDPVCGMRLERTRAVAASAHAGRAFFFCSQECKARFDADPEAFAPDEPAKEAER